MADTSFHGAHFTKNTGCPKCGKPVSTGWRDAGSMFHEECNRWDTKPYPYRDRTRDLRRTRRKLIRLIKATIVWQEARTTNWPANALDTLQGYRFRRDWIKKAMSEIHRAAVL